MKGHCHKWVTTGSACLSTAIPGEVEEPQQEYLEMFEFISLRLPSNKIVRNILVVVVVENVLFVMSVIQGANGQIVS